MMFFQRQLFASWFLCVGASLLVHEHWFRLLGDCSGARWGPSSPLLQFGGWPPTIQTARPEHLQTPQNLPVERPVFLRQGCASAQAGSHVISSGTHTSFHYPGSVSLDTGLWSSSQFHLHGSLSTVVVQSLSHVRLYNPIDCSMPGSSVLYSFLEFAQTHAPWVDDAV